MRRPPSIKFALTSAKTCSLRSGIRPLDDFTRTDCASLQAPIEARDSNNAAKKCCTRISQIFGLAIGLGLTEKDPGSRLRDITAQAPKTQQHPHLLEPELREFLPALKNTPSRLTARTAAWLCIWTASRPGMSVGLARQQAKQRRPHDGMSGNHAELGAG